MTSFEDAIIARNQGTSQTYNTVTGAGTVGPMGPAGPTGLQGADGLSAYEIAVLNGFVGTEVEWLLSIEGTDGINGTNGTDGIDGINGVGVPVGGTAGQALVKIDGTDYNTQWATVTSSGGGSITANIDAGTPFSNYAGITPIECGLWNTVYGGMEPINGGTP